MNKLIIFTTLCLLYFIVAVARYLIYRKEKIKYYFADFRINIAIASALIAIFVIIYGNIYSAEKLNELFSGW